MCIHTTEHAGCCRDHNLHCFCPRRVCKRWHRLVQDKMLWRYVDLTPYQISSRILWHLLRQHLRNGLRILKARGALCSMRKQRFLSPALLQALGTQCPSLHHLCLTEADLRLLPYDCMPTSLRTLELSQCEIPAVWFQRSAPPEAPRVLLQLQHLIIHNVPAFSDQHLFNISSQSSLRTLSLSGTYRLTDAGIQRAAPHLEDLECLVLHKCVITDAAVHFIRRHMKQLRSLEISSACSLTDAGLACIADLKCLETLCLAFSRKLSPNAIVAVCQALPQLKHLHLDGIDLEDQTIQKIQASLPNCSF
uniref:F-box and leucine rich repeat protein 12 n=1 Tax=Pelodiscus sinensis TaxID=13735 RepID=K7G3T7_PELSI|nr:F-box/LRR-repeat protein 12 [Pelodiscus sinensis]|eukprot:XP_006115606.1 F-box/LRR-repeat protein 12 [Pelodiscus sinensis]